jgi:hypothetical protein
MAILPRICNGMGGGAVYLWRSSVATGAWEFVTSTKSGDHLGLKTTARRAGRFCWLRIGVARLVEWLFGISIVLAGCLALLAGLLTTALLLTGFLTRRLILLTGLVRHVVSFHGNIMTTA